MDMSKRREEARRDALLRQEQINQNLQIPRAQNVLFKNRRTGRRASLGVSVRASMTLEASLILPFLLCAVTALLYLFAFTSVQAKESRKLVERAELLAVTVGQSDRLDPYVKLVDADRVSMPFSALSFGRRVVTRRAVVRSWVGFTGESFQNEAGEAMVYLTPGGSVYHKTRDCTYLRLSIRQISYEDLHGERNQSGSRYTPCEYCVRRGTSGGTVYITDHGISYHSSAGCQGLKRTVMAVPLSKALSEGRTLCSRCGR